MEQSQVADVPLPSPGRLPAVNFHQDSSFVIESGQRDWKIGFGSGLVSVH